MATLKISDLSVGDWVINHRGYPTKVQVITSDGNLLCGELDAKSEHCTHLWVQDIKPIPITAEVLEKNGFEEHCGGIFRYEWMWQGESSGITLCSFDEELWFVDLFFKEGKDIMCNIPTFSVHQLQHILRLAGVDIEINL